MPQSLKRTRVLLAKISRMLDLLEQTDDLSVAERDLVLSYFKDAQLFFEQDIVLEDNGAVVEPKIQPKTEQKTEAKTEQKIEKNTEHRVENNAENNVKNNAAQGIENDAENRVKNDVETLIEKSVESIVEKTQQLAEQVVEAVTPLVMPPVTPITEAVVPPKRNSWDDLMKSAEQFLGDTPLRKSAEERAISTPEPIEIVEDTPYEDVTPPVVIVEKKAENKPPIPTTQENLSVSNKAQSTVNVEDTPLQDDIVPYKEPSISRKPLVMHSDDDDAPTANNSLTIEELFEINVSENYGSVKPIKDLRTAFGINERLFTINELFAKNNAAYTSTLEALNNAASFADAKNYIIANLIEQYGWNTPQKQKKAQGFIRHVWRKFL